MGCILTADSGSTKTHWILTDEKNGTLEVATAGINPVRDTQSAIFLLLQHDLLTQLPTDNISEIHFYGAGCIHPYSESVRAALHSTFPEARISVNSDLLGAARALLRNEPGIACILGTGSNCGRYDGHQIAESVPALGYILGDEGSGAVLGRTLVGSLYKGLLGDELRSQFEAEYRTSQADIIERVYRGAQPNTFLASLTPFLAHHRSEPAIHDLLCDAFRQFARRNLARFSPQYTTANFVGSIAHVFQPELSEALCAEGLQLGRVLRNPAPEIARFHAATRH